MAQGTIERAEELLALSAGGIQLNTAFIERFNGTMRERLASLTRRSRHASRRLAALKAGMWLVGCTYNFCWPHHELSRRVACAQEHRGAHLAFSGDGRWTHRSSLECAGSADFPHPASAFRCSKAAGAAKEGKKRGFLSCFNPASPVASLAQGGLMPIHQIEVSYQRCYTTPIKHVFLLGLTRE